MQQNEMTTLTDVLNSLKQKNIDTEFKWENNLFQFDEFSFHPNDLLIIKTFRFEGESDPDDSAILYIIKTNTGLIGFSLDAYGVDSNYDEKYDNFIRQIPVADHDEQIEFKL